MSLGELETKRVEFIMARFLKQRRPPTHLRHQMDISYRITSQSVIIFETRQDWIDPTKLRETLIAKATYTKRTQSWKIYWMPSDLKWHSYQLVPEVACFAAFISEVEKDDNACFWG